MGHLEQILMENMAMNLKMCSSSLFLEYKKLQGPQFHHEQSKIN